jgi:germination protein M
MRQNKKKLSIPFTGLLLVFVALTFFSTGCTPKTNAKLYFAKYEDNLAYLVQEVRPVVNDGDFYKRIVQEIVKGPTDAQTYPTIPSTVKVNSVNVKNGVAIVDFSKEIITDTAEIPHSSTTELLAIYSIVDTLTEFKEIMKVRITIEGKQKGLIDGLYIEDFWGQVGIYDDFSRNEQVLAKDTIAITTES